jgi:GABA permease
MSRVLVVANETVGAQELLAELRRIEDEKTSTFLVVAPAHAKEHGMGVWSTEGAIEAAEQRLAQTLDVLKEEGLQADGHVGDMHPLRAIEDALLTFDADCLVISTHPPARSGWLKKDVVEQARKKFNRPVSHVVAHGEPAATG